LNENEPEGETQFHMIGFTLRHVLTCAESKGILEMAYSDILGTSDHAPKIIAGFQCHAIQNSRSKLKSKLFKYRIKEKIERNYAKTLAKIQVTVFFSSARYVQKRSPQIYRDFYGDAMAAGNHQKHLSPRFATKALTYLSRNPKVLK